MDKEVALIHLGIDRELYYHNYDKAKSKARKSLAQEHPDNNTSTDTSKFILKRKAYNTLFRNHPPKEDKPIVYTKPKERKTISLKDLNSYKCCFDKEIIVEIPIEFNNGNTTLYIKYDREKCLYSKSIIVPHGAKYMMFNETTYEITKEAKYIFTITDYFKLELDIMFEK